MLLHYYQYKEDFPEHEVIILCNEKEEAALLQKFKIPAVFANHNALLDYNCYTLIENKEKIYDAVLNSRLDRWKRHILAKKIRNIGLITYGFLETKEEENYLKFLRRSFPHGTFFNYADDGSYRWLSQEEINDIYAQSSTGLILSEVEGACFASCEYLLSGLPVVSTKNFGGRNVYFRPEYSRIVDPSQDAVLAAVNDLKSRALDPAEIRSSAIEIIKSTRSGFLEAWQMIYDTEGVHKNASEQWSEKYRNKMSVTIPDEEVPKYLQSHIDGTFSEKSGFSSWSAV